MSNLPKDLAKLHRQAQALVDLDRPLTWSEREFVMENWQASEEAAHGLDGAFFTPTGLAVDMSVEVSGPEVQRVLDLCAGIGRLAWASINDMGAPDREMVCVERNPEYVRVGRKVLPEARWICADIFDLPEDLGRFDMVISNPPYGFTERSGDGPGVTSRRFEYHALAVAAEVGRWGVFLIPQQSAPFRYSGKQRYEEARSAEYEQFERDTGLCLEMGCSIDTSFHLDQWRGVSPATEIVVCDFTRTPRTAPAPVPASALRGRQATAAVEAVATLF
ncbi:methyltransferase domain-containing protein (plasmid) [Kitasatospora sp. NBC_00374]|uniref:methyltransferase domain-containing protein n=1 Tax=Kitasatospora sp. NBC_00374 TaxID=2975964 RepID=UPI002F90FDA0